MLPVSSLLPIAISAAATVADKLAENAARGVSFASQLTGQADHSDSGQPSPARSTAATTHTSAADMARYTQQQRQLAQALRQLETQILPRLQQAGVDLSEPITLQVDPLGHVLETGGHMDRDRIEHLFATDPQLSQAVQQVLQTADAVAGITATNQPRMRLVINAAQTPAVSLAVPPTQALN